MSSAGKKIASYWVLFFTYFTFYLRLSNFKISLYTSLIVKSISF